MKKFLILLLFQSLIPVLQASDSEFRYHYLEGCTGVPSVITDSKGNATCVHFSKDSDPVAITILDALIIQDGIWGTTHPEEGRGIKYDQGIILSGSFTSAVKPYFVQGIQSGHYREFKISNIKIKFLFARWNQVKMGETENPPDDPYIVEFHFELCTLLPKGIIVNGQPLDLKKYELHADQNDNGLK